MWRQGPPDWLGNTRGSVTCDNIWHAQDQDNRAIQTNVSEDGSDLDEEDNRDSWISEYLSYWHILRFRVG